MKTIAATAIAFALVAASDTASAGDWTSLGAFDAEVMASKGTIHLVFCGSRGSDPRKLLSVRDEDAIVDDFDGNGYPDVGYSLEVLEATEADDGRVDIITAPGTGGGPHVVIFAYDPEFRGGVYVATGDVTGDGIPDLVVAAGPGGGPHVK